MTTLKDLATLTGGTLHGVGAQDPASLEISSASLDSTSLAPHGALFCAVPGTHTHGATFAAATTAAAILSDAEGAAILAQGGAQQPYLIVDDVRRWMGEVSAQIYAHPSRSVKVIGITGTSGKTTTSYFVESVLRGCGYSVGIIGTTGTRINGTPIPTALTTPEAPTMQALLRRMVDEGVTHVVMEVSSHALALGRVRGIRFAVAAFTNISRDHLDFHPTMEHYFDTKASLFSELYGNPVPVICIDDAWGRALVSRLQAKENSPASVGYTVSTLPHGHTTGTQGATLLAHHWTAHATSINLSGEQHIHIQATASRPQGHVREHDWDYRIALAGSFNVANSAIALACVEALGHKEQAASIERASHHLATVHVPGRMQAITVGQDFLAMVDYAHKPAAVASLVSTLSSYLPNPEGRIGIVIGAGGNRDQDKRPMMGYEAAHGAHAVFITDDNPRDEDPAEIRAQVLRGAQRAASEIKNRDIHIEEVADRAQAIARAVHWARPGDAIVIAGKGHEKGQLVAGKMHEFDDVTELQKALTQRVAEQADRSSAQ